MATKTVSRSVTLKRQAAAKKGLVTKANNAFMKLKPADKRVQIARDVLAQLEVGRLIATSGIWLDNKKGNLVKAADVKNKTELQSLLKKENKCTACALGGMFMCTVERANKLKVSELTDFGDARPDYGVGEDDVLIYMRRFFDEDQLDLIEYCFEQGDGQRHPRKESDRELALAFFDVLDEEDRELPELRMRLIMENIIANKGNFVVERPPQMKPTYFTLDFKG